jgi:hypothetical protein
MEIDGFKVTVQRNGEKTRLMIQGVVYGVSFNMTRPELEALALLLARNVGEWRDEDVSQAAAQPQAEPSAPVMINPTAQEAT